MHITISGKLGSGKSTICKILADKYGFEIYCTGKIQREMALKMGISTLEMNEIMSNDIKYDKMIDDAVLKLSQSKTDNIIFDSRMAWHFAKNSFRVFVTVDPQIAARRVINAPRGIEETYIDEDDARIKLLARSHVENARFSTIYNVDNLDYSNYDLIIDSSYCEASVLSRIIYDEYKKCDTLEEFPKSKILISPKSVYPTADIKAIDRVSEYIEYKSEENFPIEPIDIFCYEGYHFVIDGHYRLLAALTMNADFIPARNVKQDDNPLKIEDSFTLRLEKIGLTALHTFENASKFKYASYPAMYR